MKKIFSRVLALMLALTLLFTCALPAEAATVKISRTKATMYVARTLTLKVTGTSKTVTWSSSDKSVAGVSTSGKVTARKKGTAVISAKVGGKTYKCTVTVKKNSYTFTGDQTALATYSNLPQANITNKKKCNIKAKLIAMYYNSKGQLIVKANLYNTKDSSTYTLKKAFITVTDNVGTIADIEASFNSVAISANKIQPITVTIKKADIGRVTIIPNKKWTCTIKTN